MNKCRVVLKVGGSNISDGETIKTKRIAKLAELIQSLRTKYNVILVSSGATPTGHTRIKMDKSSMPNKQALASIGQPLLMQIYRDEFNLFDIEVAQVLLTKYNFDSQTQIKHAKDCIDTLLSHNVLPIINENDSTSVSEFIGDNDRLGAYVAYSFDAEILVILSDIDGYYDDNPKKNPNAKILSHITHIDSKDLQAPQSPNAEFATGGIVTKLIAAQYLLERKKAMFLSNGNTLEITKELLLNGVQQSGTLFGNWNIRNKL